MKQLNDPGAAREAAYFAALERAPLEQLRTALLDHAVGVALGRQPGRTPPGVDAPRLIFRAICARLEAP